ncbi:MAG: proline dehydrogenase family protein [Anaerolineae bacterium]|nr:proline dehydrogenase family protein [Anaerolineae bacterium]
MKGAQRLLMGTPGVRRLARRFVAGDTLDEAIDVTRALNARKLKVTLACLGEHVHNEADATRATAAYLAVLERIAATGVDSNISVKPTHLGMEVSDDLFAANLRRVLEKAKEASNFARIDMEDSPFTERTLSVYRALRDGEGFRNVGVVIQAYLYRSADDMHRLAEEGANVRLCKGAYKEPPSVAMPEKKDVDANYIRLADGYLSEPARACGAYLAAATHDDKMIAAVKESAQRHGVPKDGYEFQMLYGVRSATQDQLAADGYRMRVYVPFGSDWYGYLMRRLAERPANLWFMMRNFGRG